MNDRAKQKPLALALASIVLALSLIALFWSWQSNVSRAPDAPPASAAIPTEPAPQLSPMAVAMIQMKALQLNEADNRGIAVCYNFASPANKQRFGSLDAFVPQFTALPFRAMIGHRKAQVTAATVRDDKAMVFIHMIDSDANAWGFAFLMTRQTDGPVADCWMTDGVNVIDPRDLPQGEAPPARVPSDA